MNCTWFELAAVSDDPADRARAAEHAATCPACRAAREVDEDLAAAVAAWRETAPAPGPALERRILAAVRAPRRGVHRAWFGVAAALLVAAVLAGLLAQGPAPTTLPAGTLLVDDALARTRSVEGAQERAVERLEQQAAPRLARAGDPSVPPAEAAHLLAARGRLQSLDAQVAELESFLARNEGNAVARAALLAALAEKAELLRQVIAARRSSRSNYGGA